MFRFPNTFTDLPIRSLQNGRQIGKLGAPVINPDTLRIEAFSCKQRVKKDDLYLFTNDIREYSRLGIIVDSDESLMAVDDLVRLQNLLEINFELIGKKVVTEHKKKIGKVTNYTLDDISFKIEKLYVQPGLLKGFSSGDRIIGRQQIINVTDTTIVVKEATIKAEESAPEPNFSPAAN